MKGLFLLAAATALAGTIIGSAGIVQDQTASDLLLLVSAGTALLLARAREEP